MRGLISTNKTEKVESPISAKALFVARENQLSSPTTVPTAVPRLRRIVKHSPPALGMAEVISARLSIPGKARTPAGR